MSERPVFRDLAAYRAAEVAHTHKSTAGSQDTADPDAVSAALAEVARVGYVVFERLLDDEQVARVRSAVVPHLPTHRGRNNFEGFATQRVYSVVDKTLACNPLIEHPLVLGLLDRLLEPNYLLSQLQVINILPGEEQQPLHYDDAYYPWPRPRRAVGAATIWAIDPFTETNGATVVVPGSHAWPDRTPRTEDLEQLRSVVMPAGSLLFFLGTTWHAGGANRSEHPRLCVTAQYCAPWCRQQENYSLSVSRAQARRCSEHVQRMLGYSIHAPFMGFVNGMHPKRLLAEGDP